MQQYYSLYSLCFTLTLFLNISKFFFLFENFHLFWSGTKIKVDERILLFKNHRFSLLISIYFYGNSKLKLLDDNVAHKKIVARNHELLSNYIQINILFLFYFDLFCQAIDVNLVCFFEHVLPRVLTVMDIIISAHFL